MEAQELCGGVAASLKLRANHCVVAGEGVGSGCLRQRTQHFLVIILHLLVVNFTRCCCFLLLVLGDTSLVVSHVLTFDLIAFSG